MQRTQTICLVILTTIAVGFSLFYLKSVLLPFVIALFIFVGCGPIVEYLQTRLKLNRYFAFGVAFAIGTMLLLAFAMMVWFSINDLTKNMGAYEQRLNAISEWVSKTFLEETAPSEGIETEVETTDGTGEPAGDVAGDAKQAINEFFTFASGFLQSQLLNIAGSLSSLLSYGVLILIFVFFLMLGQGSFEQNQPKLIGQVISQVRQYLVMKTVISILTGFAFGFVLWMFGVPMPYLFGFLAFLLNFIPNIGPLISTLTPVPFLVLNADMSPTMAVSCFLAAGAVQFISGNVVETKIMGESFDVSPVFLLLALMLFGLVWGIIGMFLATPIVSIIKIILAQHESTRPLAELMAGRWAVSGTT